MTPVFSLGSLHFVFRSIEVKAFKTISWSIQNQLGAYHVLMKHHDSLQS